MNRNVVDGRRIELAHLAERAGGMAPRIGAAEVGQVTALGTTRSGRPTGVGQRTAWRRACALAGSTSDTSGSGRIGSAARAGPVCGIAEAAARPITALRKDRRSPRNFFMFTPFTLDRDAGVPSSATPSLRSCSPFDQRLGATACRLQFCATWRADPEVEATVRLLFNPSLNAIIARSLFGTTGLISRWKSCSAASASWPTIVLPVTTIAGSAASKPWRAARRIASTPVWPAAAGSRRSAGRARIGGLGAPRPVLAAPRRCRRRSTLAPQPLSSTSSPLAHRRLVFDDDDQPARRSVKPSGAFGPRAGTPPARGAWPSGTSSVNTVPRPTRERSVERRAHQRRQPLDDRQPQAQPLALVRLRAARWRRAPGRTPRRCAAIGLGGCRRRCPRPAAAACSPRRAAALTSTPPSSV